MEKRTIEAIEKEIAETKAELEDVHGTETEVYARIVGYYRAVKNWNKGKKDEFSHRKLFTLDDSEYTISSADSPCQCSEIQAVIRQEQYENTETASSGSRYELFTRRTCPNCPPVKEFMQAIPLEGTEIDVDTEEGLSSAASKGVFAPPTVIVYGENGAEIARGHNVEELTAIFDSILVKETV